MKPFSTKASYQLRSWHAGTALVSFLIICVLLTFCAWEPQLLSQHAFYLSISIYLAGCILLYCTAVVLINKWRESILVLLSVCGALMVSETALRTFFPYRSMLQYTRHLRSQRYHHVLPKNKKMCIYGRGTLPSVIQTNEDGLRTGYDRNAFLQYRHRIIVLGDSFAFGVHVQQEKAFPELIEKMLRKKTACDDIAVINAGIPSYSPFLQHLLFTGILYKYRPTLVMLVLDASDIGDDFKYEHLATVSGESTVFNMMPEEDLRYYGATIEQIRPYIRKPLRALNALIKYPYTALCTDNKFSWHVTNYVDADFYDYHFDYYNFAVLVSGTVEKNRFFIYRHPLAETEKYFSKTLENINKIANAVHSVPAEFMLFVLPRFHHWNPRECPNNWEKNNYSLNEPYQYEYLNYFDSQKAAVDYPIINLLRYFQQTDAFPLCFNNDPHLNENGHVFVAESITGYLMKYYSLLKQLLLLSDI